MLKKVVLVLAILVAGFLMYVASRDGKFHYERSGVIHASPSAIFPYISQFKKGESWSPYEKKDTSMKKTFSGNEGEVGSVMEFEGDRNVGAGRLEIVGLIPNEQVQIKLTMLKPFHGENLVTYQLTAVESGTRFTWSMSGDGGFLGKLMSVLIDCEKMVGDDFSKGIESLKTVVEAAQPPV